MPIYSSCVDIKSSIIVSLLVSLCKPDTPRVKAEIETFCLAQSNV
jgi:hypothetical protein